MLLHHQLVRMRQVQYEESGAEPAVTEAPTPGSAPHPTPAPVPAPVCEQAPDAPADVKKTKSRKKKPPAEGKRPTNPLKVMKEEDFEPLEGS